ncbi:MAG: hypothetical protein QOE36_1782 [Gaiellaceae bacterium]|jgi:uncharacterized protein YbjT (DUF2867 family)|nr:hypothetical protein [Gaiellaceae bacterium]
MAEQKVIAVVGATGSQGGGLVRAIQSDPDGEFRARAITRDPNSEAAQALAATGAEVVQGDLDDPASIESAFQGAHGAYCVTFFWAHFSPDTEGKHAQTMAKAAKDAGVEHVIWSTLEDTRQWVPIDDDRMPTLQEKYTCPHYDSKAQVDHVFTDAGVPTTFLRTSFYWDNMILFGMGPKRGEDGKLVFTLPMADKRLPSMAAEDIGKAALGIFKRGDEFIGKTVGISGAFLTGEQFADSLSKAYGEEVTYNAVTPDVYRSFGFPGADDIGNMFQVKSDFEQEYTGNRDLELTRSLNPELQTLDQWLAENKDKIPLE